MGHGIKRFLRLLENGIHLPPQLLASEEFKVLHISDTPSAIYSAVTGMMEQIRPDLIVHTGDLADDIKLGENPGCLDQYRRTAGPFLESLALGAPRFVVVPGNHDFVPFVKNNVPTGSVVSSGSVIKAGEEDIGVAHTLSDLPAGARYNLYGHNFDVPVHEWGTMFLNGVASINVILLPSGEIFRLPYPHGTNRYRKYKENPPTLI
ncbi:MAG TPA: metallophosphoesterase [Clostridia bacterium]|nr:metallophosphoesterase [Clostridia bacterium]